MIHIIIGTKAQLIKMAPLMLRLQEMEITYNFIFTGQHQETMDGLRENFDLKQPDITLHRGRDITSVFSMLVWLIEILYQSFRFRSKIFRGDNKKEAVVVVHGDTFSTLLGALMGRMAGFRVAHIESGLRSFNLFHPFPEELTRLITFCLSGIYYCPGKQAVDNLKRFHGIKVNTYYNTLIDALRTALLREQNVTTVAIPTKPYCIVTTHRFESLCRRSLARRNVDLIENIAEKIKTLFILHPITERKLTEYGLMVRLTRHPSIETRPRYDYFNFVRLIDKAAFVVSDGGSNQEECFYMGKPCLLLRATTERNDGLGSNALLSYFDPKAVNDFVEHSSSYHRPMVSETLSPTEIILGHLLSSVLSMQSAS